MRRWMCSTNNSVEGNRRDRPRLVHWSISFNVKRLLSTRTKGSLGPGAANHPET
jgi:hypothetical protein